MSNPLEKLIVISCLEILNTASRVDKWKTLGVSSFSFARNALGFIHRLAFLLLNSDEINIEYHI